MTITPHHYFGGGGQTDLQPLTLAFVAIVGVLLFVLPKKYAYVPLMAASVLISLDEQLIAGRYPHHYVPAGAGAGLDPLVAREKSNRAQLRQPLDELRHRIRRLQHLQRGHVRSALGRRKRRNHKSSRLSFQRLGYVFLVEILSARFR